MNDNNIIVCQSRLLCWNIAPTFLIVLHFPPLKLILSFSSRRMVWMLDATMAFFTIALPACQLRIIACFLFILFSAQSHAQRIHVTCQNVEGHGDVRQQIIDAVEQVGEMATTAFDSIRNSSQGSLSPDRAHTLAQTFIAFQGDQSRQGSNQRLQKVGGAYQLPLSSHSCIRGCRYLHFSISDVLDWQHTSQNPSTQ